MLPCRGQRAVIRRHLPFSYSSSAPRAMPPRPCAFSRITENTGVKSRAEELTTYRTLAVAVCCSNASSRSAVRLSSSARHSASLHRRSAMICSGSDNVLSGGELIYRPSSGRHPDSIIFRSERDAHRLLAKVGIGFLPRSGRSGIGASLPLPRVAATVCFLITERALSLNGRNWSSCPYLDLRTDCFARSVGWKEGRLDASVTRARNVQWALAGP
jgi:hypothetical protein